MTVIRRLAPRVHYSWVIVAASFMFTSMAFGVIYSYGVFFKPLAQDMGWNRASTSGVYSLNAVTRGVFATFSGWATDKWGPRLTIVGGTVLIAIGLMMSSQMKSIWQFYVLYGLVVGIGMSVSISPLQATTARWFASRRGMALGIVSSGVGLGPMILAPVSERLITGSGWRLAYVSLGGAALVLGLSSALFLRKNPAARGLRPYGAPSQETRAQPNAPQKSSAGPPATTEYTLRKGLASRSLWIMALAFFFSGICIQTIMVHLVNYATDRGIDPLTAATLVSSLSVGGVVGRLGIGTALDRIGSRAIFIGCMVLMAATMASFIYSGSLWQLHASAAIFGVCYGGIATVMPVIVGQWFGLNSVGALVGITTMFATSGGALGSYEAGQVFDRWGTYSPAFVVAMGAALLTVPLLLLLGTKQARP